MSLLKKLAGETAIYGIGNIAGRLLNYIILTPYLTRRFLPSEYGVHATLYAYAAFLMVIFTYRMETAFFRFASLAEKEKQTGEALDASIIAPATPNKNAYFTAGLSLLITTSIFVTLMIVFAQPIANFIQYPDHKEYVIWFALIIGFDAISAIPLAKLRLDARPFYFVAAKMTGIVVNVLFILFFLEICPQLIEQGHQWATGIYSHDNRIGLVFIAN